MKAVAKCFFVVTTIVNKSYNSFHTHKKKKNTIRVALTVPYNNIRIKKKNKKTHNIDVIYCTILSLYIEAQGQQLGFKRNWFIHLTFLSFNLRPSRSETWQMKWTSRSFYMIFPFVFSM